MNSTEVLETRWAKLEVRLDDGDAFIPDGQWYIAITISDENREADGRIHIGAGMIDISQAEMAIHTRLTIPDAEALKNRLEDLIAQTQT